MRQTSERQIERVRNQQVGEETITGVDGRAKRRRNNRLHDSGGLPDDRLTDIIQRVVFWASQRYSMKRG
jgi:hypothetical protein